MLTKCCCCSLRTGSLIIAWLGIVGTILQFIACIFCTVYSDEIADNLVAKHGKLTSENDEEAREYISKMFFYIGIFGIICCIFVFILYGLMIYGIDKNKPKFLLPYLILSGFGLAIYALGAVFSLIGFLTIGDFQNFFGQLIGSAIGLAIGGYLWTVVYSLYKTIRQTGYGQAPNRVEYGISKR